MFRTLHRKQMVVTKSLGILVGDWASANISSLCTHLTRSSYRGKSKLKFYVPHAASIQSHGFLLTLPLGITFNKLRGLDEMPGTDLGLAKYKAVVFCAVLSLHSYLLFFFFFSYLLFVYLFVCFWQHSAVLMSYSWLWAQWSVLGSSGNHMKCWGSNPCQPGAKQTIFLIPFKRIFIFIQYSIGANSDCEWSLVSLNSLFILFITCQ